MLDDTRFVQPPISVRRGRVRAHVRLAAVQELFLYGGAAATGFVAGFLLQLG